MLWRWAYTGANEAEARSWGEACIAVGVWSIEEALRVTAIIWARPSSVTKRVSIDQRHAGEGTRRTETREWVRQPQSTIIAVWLPVDVQRVPISSEGVLPIPEYQFGAINGHRCIDLVGSIIPVVIVAVIVVSEWLVRVELVARTRVWGAEKAYFGFKINGQEDASPQILNNPDCPWFR